MFGHCLFLVALVLDSASAQVALGGVCWSTTTGVVKGGCASGTQCGPWLPNGGTWDGSSPWYCLALPKLSVGASCDYATFKGLCDTGLSCCSGVCTSGTTCTTTAAPTTAAPTTAAPTTAAPTTAAPTTAAPTTAAPTTAAATTAACDIAAQVVCGDTSYPSMYEGRCCVSPYTCSLITGSTRTSMCQGTDLPEGSTCWSNSASSGTCVSGTICQKASSTDATGTCTVSTLAACSGPTVGVSGGNICRNAALPDANYGSCCPNPDTGIETIMCFPATDGGSNPDSFCMAYNIPAGGSCGTTSADNYNGYCASGLNCINGICSSATTTAAPATTCGYSGEKCWDSASVQPPTGFSGCCNNAPCGPILNPTTTDYNCAASAGEKPCDPKGTLCSNSGLQGVISTVKCCNQCALASGQAPTTTEPLYCS